MWKMPLSGVSAVVIFDNGIWSFSSVFHSYHTRMETLIAVWCQQKNHNRFTVVPGSAKKGCSILFCYYAKPFTPDLAYFVDCEKSGYATWLLKIYCLPTYKKNEGAQWSSTSSTYGECRWQKNSDMGAKSFIREHLYRKDVLSKDALHTQESNCRQVEVVQLSAALPVFVCIILWIREVWVEFPHPLYVN
jgi:hypothetical protein